MNYNQTNVIDYRYILMNVEYTENLKVLGTKNE
jgi:hypothetical protein